MKYLLSIVIFFILLVSCRTQAHSQQLGERLMSTAVGIYNSSNNKITILLGESSVKMDTFQVKENELWYSPSYNKNPIINIQTQNHLTTYQLKLGNYYMIFWNENKKYWDVKKTKKRQ